MTFLYESLTPERFQQLAQSVLTDTFPDLQCLPVSQPDGGRDAFVHVRSRDRNKELIVFQIKFVRHPKSAKKEDKIEEWLTLEKPKLASLKKWGATKYYIVTNLSGTSHFKTGTIDRAEEYLSNALSIPAQVWWREDLDRRIEKTSSIKWSYPDIIKGSDLLELLVRKIAKSTEQQRSAIQAYLAAQYEDDREVRFKQVELQNKLLGLFVDVPMRISPRNENHPDLTEGYEFDFGDVVSLSISDIESRNLYQRRHRASEVKAASTILNKRIGHQTLVLEGAPGQGKSTITQFVCQIHRMRLLNYVGELKQVNATYLKTEIRLPLRIDLRDYAEWLNGKNPFAAEGSSLRALNTALESFLVAQISHMSGGFDFSVNDLSVIAAESPLLIVLDGFDEVADIPTRRRMVDEISKAARRLSTSAQSLEMIVTSRPSAFANSPGFPSKDWVYLELTNLTREDIEQYSERWIQARRLSGPDTEQVKSVLATKIDQPHIRQLARNPMQLAILLALIHSKGPSLPDKRTALYDKYVELFMSREAEKSDVVREHQEVLVDMHRLLGWVLHAAAEKSAKSGRISEDSLKSLLRSYLDAEGYRPELVDDLFSGVVERIFVLVSRAVGLYEFEVQPLREYFAGRHLYETAPYSPPGGEKSGTKPERFSALARNSYWLNVTRFYCGCYSKGELNALLEGLEELCDLPEYVALAYPRWLATLLTSDWVFSQQPNLIRKVVRLVSQDGAFRVLAAAVSGLRGLDVAIPDKVGRDEMRTAALRNYNSARRHDEHRAWATIVNQNSSISERLETWLKSRPSGSDGTARWLRTGADFSLFATIPTATLSGCAQGLEEEIAPYLLRAERFDSIVLSEALMHYAVEYVLNSGTDIFPLAGTTGSDEAASALRRALGVFNPNIYRFDSGHPTIRHLLFPYKERPQNRDSPLLSRVTSFLKRLYGLVGFTYEAWTESLDPWNVLVEAARSTWGERWGVCVLSVLASAIRSRSSRGVESDLWDGSVPLCERMRHARLKAGDAIWWARQLDRAPDENAPDLVMTAAAAWMSEQTIAVLAGHFGERLDRASDSEWLRLSDLIARLEPGARRGASTLSLQKITKASPRLRWILTIRAEEKRVASSIERLLARYDGNDPVILRTLADAAIAKSREIPMHWGKTISLLARIYEKGVTPSIVLQAQDAVNLDLDSSHRILKDAQLYPMTLVAAAEAKLNILAGAQAPSVAKVARAEKWFEPKTLRLMKYQ